MIANDLNTYFIGRKLNPLTMCYEFDDKSARPIPAERALEIMDFAELNLGKLGQGLAVLGMVEAAKSGRR